MSIARLSCLSLWLPKKADREKLTIPNELRLCAIVCVGILTSNKCHLDTVA